MAIRLGRLALLVIAAILLGSCQSDEKDPQLTEPPLAPNLLVATSQTDNTISLSWNDRSQDEDGFNLYIRREGLPFRTDVLAANRIQYTVTGLSAGTSYLFILTAFNGSGESDTTAQLTAQTSGFPPPEPPFNVTTQVVGLNVVRVGWTRATPPQSYLVSRRLLDNPTWTTIGTRPGTDSTYNDSTVAPLTNYFYRVGSQVQQTIVWSLDSAHVLTPDGPPTAPDSLSAEVIVGTGVILSWHDDSDNETGFHISRDNVVMDSVGANVTTYLDHLTEVADYSYRVRAYNAQGVSNWSAHIVVEYDFCSDGAIPLCVNNWWQYTVTDSIGPDYTVQQQVLRIDYPTGQDHYLIGAFPTETPGNVDTLHYLRNFNDGCRTLHYPSDGNVQLLYKYPATVGQSYVIGQDTMLVASTGTDKLVNGVLYTNCYIYQREIPDEFMHVLTIYVKPLTVGVVFEEERINDEIVVRRGITEFFVQNN